MDSSLSEEQKKSLAETGYCLIPYTESDWKDRGVHFDQIKNSIQELVNNEGTAGGWDHKKELQKIGSHPEPGTQRVSNILSKNEIFRPFFMIPEVLAGVVKSFKPPLSFLHLVIESRSKVQEFKIYISIGDREDMSRHPTKWL